MFWWKEDCEATDPPTLMPSPSPTPLRGSNHPNESGGGGSQSGIFSGSSGSNNGADSNGNGVANSSTGGTSVGNGDGTGTSSGKKKPGTMSFAAAADTYIRVDRPEKNYGKKKHLGASLWFLIIFDIIT